MNLLKGYLTYIMAAVAVLFGIYAMVTNTYMGQAEALATVWAGLTVFGIRRAM